MPNLFSKFPKINYTFRYLDKNGTPVIKTKEITNIHIKFKFSESTLAKSGVAYPFQLRDFDRPDSLAEKYYGSSDLYWLVLYSDQRYDTFNEMPKSESIFYEYLARKYENSARTFYFLTSLLLVSPESIKSYIESEYSIDDVSLWVFEQSVKNIDLNANLNPDVITLYETAINDIIENSTQIILENRKPDSTEPANLSQELIEWYQNALIFLSDIKEYRKLSLAKLSFPSAFKIDKNEPFVLAKNNLKNFEEIFYKKYKIKTEDIIRYTTTQALIFYDKDGYEIDPYEYFRFDLKFSNKVKTIYEFEEELNQLSRTSFLVDSRYSKQIKDEFEDALNQVIKDFEE